MHPLRTQKEITHHPLQARHSAGFSNTHRKTTTMKTPTLPCPKCGSETNPEYRYQADGDRIPVWRCLNQPDCGYVDY